MNRFDDLFKKDDDKAYMTFTYRNCGKSVTLNNEYPYDCTWHEVLDDVIKALEGEFGYSFRLRDNFGIYHDGKKDDD